MPSSSAERLQGELKGYGVPEENVRLFGQEIPRPDLQDYLALNSLRRTNRPAPDGVVEHQGRPLLYFIDEQRLSRDASRATTNLFDDEADELPAIFRQLACRGERVHLARVQMGKLMVAPVALTDRQPDWEEYTPDTTRGKCLFSRLTHGIVEGEDLAAGDAVFKRLFELLKHAANKIAKDEVLRPDALSLVGRALFCRFLRDRGVLENYSVKKIAPAAMDWTDCFLNPKNSSDTCAWLDKTFNGDFLQLTDNGNESFFQRIHELTGGEIFHHLSAVVRGHQPSGNDYQPVLHWDWQTFDFAQIPVGLFSQVYEAFSWEWTPKEARKTSQKYTPRNIATTLLGEVLDTLPNFKTCRILDPACGAGVFLVLAFRRLYLEHWRSAKNQIRPTTEDIRRILERQLVGLDVSESALKLAALSLYLTAIELDPEPQPPDKLRFKDMRGHVLHNVREPESNDGAALGSLGTHLGNEFDRQFDVVVSNPPWTSVDQALGKQMAAVCREVISGFDPAKGPLYVLPDNNPDLPFIWKAMEWCKPGGRIAMALPARLLLKTEQTPIVARSVLFSLLQIDGIINGTNLADTPVWPDMNQPWILLFATNKRPQRDHSTYFVTLPLDLILNKTGQYRIDSESTKLIDNALATEKPWIWKALSVGTMLDVGVIETMRAAGGELLDAYWKRTVGPNRTSKGYRIAESQKKLHDCRFLKGLPDLNSTEMFRFTVEPGELTEFTRSRIERPRKTTVYDPPLVLIKEAPGEVRENGRALIALSRIAYNESFNGYSACGHPDGELLVRYLHLFIHSDIWLYYLLVTSPQFGAERRRFHKADLENCPLIPFDKLTEPQLTTVSKLSRSLEAAEPNVWADLDAFFSRLYGLKEPALDVIKDTLSIALPYETSRHRASNPPTEAEKRTFVTAVKRAIGPLVPEELGSLAVERWKPPTPKGELVSPFDILVIHASERLVGEIHTLADGNLEHILRLANETGATQIILKQDGALVVGIYSQYRYWTPSRARLLSGDILRFHLDTITE